MQLSSFTPGKNNNFNLIRIIAALAVLVGHSFALLRQPEPFSQLLGMSLGSMAVDIFFIASGFLVAGSLLIKQSMSEYVLARILRIYPALLTMLLVTVFLLGAFFTSFSLASYYADSQIYLYLIKCLTLISGVRYYLPGVFDSNPFKGAVNGSLWTLVYEVKMYIYLAMLWLTSSLVKHHRVKFFEYLIVLCTALAIALVFVHHFYIKDESNAVRLFFMFFSGASYWILKERVKLLGPLFGGVSVALLVSPFFNQQVFFVLYQLGIAYLLFYLAYIPAGTIRKYNAAGDYSYGVYIYAFPVQQSVVALFPDMSVLQMMLLSALITLILAILSWHLIERRALRLKEFLIRNAGPSLQLYPQR